MRLRLQHAAALAPLLAGCSSGFLRATNEAPFEFGKLRAALWVEAWSDEDPRYASGGALVVLWDQELGCEDVAPWADYDFDFQDWEGGDGVMAYVDWWADANGEAVEAPGWEGAYWYGYEAATRTGDTFVSRELLPFVHADRTLISGGLGGASALEVRSADDDVIVGTLDSPWVRAEFQAEVCPSSSTDGDDDDTGYSYTYRRSQRARTER